MALLSFVESAPRAYRLKESNAAPPISTSSGTIPADVRPDWADLRSQGPGRSTQPWRPRPSALHVVHEEHSSGGIGSLEPFARNVIKHSLAGRSDSTVRFETPRSGLGARGVPT